jgi:heat shock protein HslJ
MNCKTSFNQRFTHSLTVLVVGVVGITATPLIAQSSPTQALPFYMAQSPALTGSWRLANMTSGDLPTPMVPSTDLTADFSGGRISGSGGCNRFNGSYQARGGQLKIGPLASTRKACEQFLMDQEFMYLKALQGATRYEVNSDGLQIFYTTTEGSGVLRFTSQNVRGLW